MPHKYSTPLTLLILNLITSKSASQTNVSHPHPLTNGERYVRGVYEVPEAPNALPLIYDTYFPIIFNLTLPIWDIQTMKIQFWKDHNNCTGSDTYSDGYPCPVMFHTNKLIEYFVGNMTLWKNLFLDDPFHENDDHENEDLLNHPLIFTRNSTIFDHEFYCRKITPHFATLQTTRARVGEYLDLLSKCENEVVKISKNLRSTASSLESEYHLTFASYVSDYWDRLPSMIEKQSGVLNLWTSLESMLLLHQFMETQKWTQALDSCQQGRIPWTLLDHDDISQAVRSHSDIADHQLAIPLETEMSKYFKLPLTDCVFIERETLIVRILVPTRKHAKKSKHPGKGVKGADALFKNPYKLIKFEPIVFHGEKGEFCWIDGIRGKRFIADSVHPGNLYETECSDEGQGGQSLCHVPPTHWSSHDAAEPCSQALYSDDEEEILASCHLSCAPLEKRPFNFKYFNFAHTFQEDNFIYALAEDEGIQISCRGQGQEGPIKLSKLSWGAWNLTLPCGCDIEGAPSIGLEIRPPCQDQLIVEKIRPYHWRRVEERGRVSRVATPSAAGSSNFGREGDELIQFLDQRYGSSPSTFLHVGMLWLIILILCGAVGVLAYFVVQLQHWKANELFKQTRLIYGGISEGSGGGGGDFPLETGTRY